MPGQDRRQYQRISLITKVTHLRGDFFHYYYSRDLSQGGIFLETREPFPAETPVMLEFPLPGISHRVTCQGLVVRVVKPVESEPALVPGMGIQFTEMDETTKGMLAEFIANMIAR
jgi:type IV pilus assembly protein PilZ